MQRIPAVLRAGAHVLRFRPGELWLPCHTRAMGYIHNIAFAAAVTTAVTYGSFDASVHREIRVALVKGHHGIFWAGVQLHTRASGHVRLLGHLVPTAEIE
jgi:hypothetical protein